MPGWLYNLVSIFTHDNHGLLSVPVNCPFSAFLESFVFVSIPSSLPKLSNKNCERFKILPFVEANKLAGHNSTGASRRHAPPGSETKDVMAVVVARVSTPVSDNQPQFLQGSAESQDDACIHNWVPRGKELPA